MKTKGLSQIRVYTNDRNKLAVLAKKHRVTIAAVLHSLILK